MTRVLHISIVLLLVTAFAAAQKKGSIEGVWKIVETVTTGGGGSPKTDPNPLPNLMIVSRGHYMMMRDSGDKPRALYQSIKATDAEKMAAFDSFFANGGTYEISGNTMTIHPTVARVPNYSAGGWTKYTFRVEGKNLYLTDKSTDTTFNIGGKVVPIAPVGFETTTKFVRVE